jgi:hypothetical protein
MRTQQSWGLGVTRGRWQRRWCGRGRRESAYRRP